jgi:UDP-glucose 4-epimerase
MVFSSSAVIFGEPEYLPIDENHPKNPENYYGFTKLEIERIMEWYDRLKGLRYASLRYFNAAGYDIEGEITAKEQNPANLLPVIMEVASGMREKLQVFGTDYERRDGTCIRDYVHVWDLAIAHVKALDYITKEDKSLFVNLGSEVGLSVLEILDAAKKATAKEIPTDFVARRAGDPECLYAVSKKAKDLLGWKAQYSDAKTLVETTWKVYKK